MQHIYKGLFQRLFISTPYPDGTWNVIVVYAVKYKYGFNSQEKDDEVYGAGNANTAEFWEYDCRLGRRFNVDPKPIESISPYACFANNPIFFQDVDGDTIQKTKAFMADAFQMASYDCWASSKAGKKFIKDYGIGGKYQHISVWFDAGDLSRRNAGGMTGIEVVNKKTGKSRDVLPGTMDKEAANLAKGGLNKTSYMKITIKMQNGLREAHKANIPNYERDYKMAFQALEGESFIHETQHLRISLISLRQFGMVQTPFVDHENMAMEDQMWYKERFDYLKETQVYWSSYYKKFKSKKFKTEDAFIKNVILDYVH
jgi:hypothetical protein